MIVRMRSSESSKDSKCQRTTANVDWKPFPKNTACGQGYSQNAGEPVAISRPRNMPVAAENALGIDSPRAWLVVVAGFFTCAIAYGVSYAFGVFLKPLEGAFGVNHATLSTLFSALSVLSYFLGPITGQLADRIGPRPVVAGAAVLMGGGLLLSARVHRFPLLYLTSCCISLSVYA